MGKIVRPKRIKPWTGIWPRTHTFEIWKKDSGSMKGIGWGNITAGRCRMSQEIKAPYNLIIVTVVITIKLPWVLDSWHCQHMNSSPQDSNWLLGKIRTENAASRVYSWLSKTSFNGFSWKSPVKLVTSMWSFLSSNSGRLCYSSIAGFGDCGTRITWTLASGPLEHGGSLRAF